MSVVRFISDLHFGHTNIAVKRGFESEYEHDEHIIKCWNNVVTNKRDVTWILGDITMEKTTSYVLLRKLNGIKKVILGNHDRPGHVPELLKYVNHVGGMQKYKGYILTHCPIHPYELSRFSANIHGHTHDKHIMTNSWDFNSTTRTLDHVQDTRYINVCCEQIGYTPKTLKELNL